MGQDAPSSAGTSGTCVNLCEGTAPMITSGDVLQSIPCLKRAKRWPRRTEGLCGHQQGWGNSTAEHAVAFLDSTQCFDEEYQRVRSDMLGGRVAFVTVQHQPNWYKAGAKCVRRTTRSSSAVNEDGGSPGEPPKRKCIHFKNLVQVHCRKEQQILF